MSFRTCVIAAAIGLAASAALAEDPTAFWKDVQARCDATAAKPASDTGRRIAQNAIDELARFDGHRIDGDGRLFHFGVTEAEHEEEYGHGDKPRLSDLAWRRVMTYWRALYGGDPADKLEVRGYRDASLAGDDAQPAALLRADASELLRAADAIADPQLREIGREAAMRAAVSDTPWSAAFVSYLVRQAGVSADAFHFANAHRVFIYDAFATSAAEHAGKAGDQLYRACPLTTTKPRVGDLVCFQREPALAKASDADVRDRIRDELAGGSDVRSVRRTHCDAVASVDAAARKMYVIGGNAYQSVTVKKLNLHGRRLQFSAAAQKGNCGGPSHWNLPKASPGLQQTPETAGCSLNDKKWFVLLQLR